MKPTGIYINGSHLYFVQTHSLLKPNLQAHQKQEFVFDLTGQPDEGQRIKAFIKANHIRTNRFILGIPRTEFCVRSLSLPTLKDDEIKHMVDHEVTHLFPVKPEELVYDHVLIDKASDGYSRVMLFAAQSSAVRGACETLKQAHIIPEAVSISTLSLYEQFLQQMRPPTGYLVVYQARSWLELLHISENKLTFTRAFPIKENKPLDSLLRSVEITARILKDTGYRIDTIILSAEKGVPLDDFSGAISRTLRCAVEIDCSLSPIEGALGESKKEKRSLNIIPQEYSKTRRLLESKRALAYLAVLLSVNFVLAANITFTKLKVRRQYLHWLSEEIKRIDDPASLIRQKIQNTQAIEDYLVSGRLSLAVLSGIYTAAPSGMELNVLEINHTGAGTGSVITGGSAPDQAQVINFAEALKKTPFITGAGVVYIRKKSDTQKTEFQIKAEFTG